MSIPRESQRIDDEIVGLLTQWLNGALGNDELRKRIASLATDELGPGARAAVEQLRAALADAFPGERDGLETVVRETAESIAYGA